MSEHAQDPQGTAQELFIHWLALRESPEPVEFSALCVAHPELAGELQRLHEKWQREEKSGEPRTGQLLERLKEHAIQNTRYRMQGEIARGGMGAILKVWDEDLRRNLAMKVILGKAESSLAGKTPPVDKRVLARFLEEALRRSCSLRR